ncbi:DUF4158 domain-containing protein [Nonomuraea sp. NPDC050680]|uniref:DUF4158 domain-containing protein n=1 Tax=Nonomuraea sp. NPDC050680 TaxID=3154630 RepID=UPI0033F25A80
MNAPGRGPDARLGLAVQLCTLSWLGFVPDELLQVPQAAVQRLATQMAVFPGVRRGRHRRRDRQARRRLAAPPPDPGERGRHHLPSQPLSSSRFERSGSGPQSPCSFKSFFAACWVR